MTFARKPANEKLRRQINCSINDDDWEKWAYLCRKEMKSSHELLRIVVREYIERNVGSNNAQYGVLKVLGKR
jgi:hypothetical protein